MNRAGFTQQQMNQTGFVLYLTLIIAALRDPSFSLRGFAETRTNDVSNWKGGGDSVAVLSSG